jgi:MscS family membrane protein
MRRLVGSILAVVVLVLATRVAHAEPPEDCKTPRAAVESVFGWLDRAHYNPAKAIRCLDRSGRSVSELRESAQRIKSVYESRALRIDPKRLSDEPNWVNPQGGKQSFLPHPGLSRIDVERQADGEWRWTRSALDRVDELHEDALAQRHAYWLEKLPAWTRTSILGLEVWQGIALLLIVFVAYALRAVIRAVVKVRLAKLAEERGAHLTAQIAQVFATPGACLLLALMLRLTYPSLGLSLDAAVVVSTSIKALVVFALVVALYRLTDVFSTHLAQRALRTESKLDDQFVPLIRKSTKVVIVIAGVLLVLQNLEVNVMSLVAGLGIGGLAVALAAKDSIANLFGSVMIFTDRPFSIGDWIKVESVEGRIEEVGFRSTKIRTLADTVVVLPNARFMEATIENFSARRARRIHSVIGIGYDTPLEKVQAFVEGIRAIIRANPNTQKDSYEIHFNGFGTTGLEIYVHFFTQRLTWREELRERHNVFSEILRLSQALAVKLSAPSPVLKAEMLADTPDPKSVSRDELAKVVSGFGPDGSASRPEAEKITEDGFRPTERG